MKYSVSCDSRSIKPSVVVIQLIFTVKFERMEGKTGEQKKRRKAQSLENRLFIELNVVTVTRTYGKKTKQTNKKQTKKPRITNMTQFHACVTHTNEKLPQMGKYGRGLIFESSTLTKQYAVKGYVGRYMCVGSKQRQ